MESDPIWRLRPEEWLFAGLGASILAAHSAVGQPLVFWEHASDAWNASLGFRFAIVSAVAVVGALIATVQFGSGIARRAATAVAAAIRDFLPLALMYLTYESMHALGPLLHGRTYDLELARADQLLFATQAFIAVPVAVFSVPHFEALAYYFAFCYSAVFIAYWGVAIYFYFCFSREVFRTYLLAVVFTSCIGYIGYALLPALGPYEARIRGGTGELGAWSGSDGARAISSFADAIRGFHLDRAPASDAFPSLHTAWVLVVVGFAARHARWLLWALVPWAVGTLLGALYFQQHYLVDILLGVPTAAAGTWAAVWVARWEPRRAEADSQEQSAAA